MSATGEPRIEQDEWEAQERGMRMAPGREEGLDPAAAKYRLVAEALRTMPRSGPPEDLAADIVKRVARREAGLERLLSRMLLVIFLIATVIVGVRYGETWWEAVRRALSGDALAWLLAGVGCMALSWLGSRLRDVAGRKQSVRAHGLG